jgi:outer membrane murein-binding lipoprotein Lpp
MAPASVTEGEPLPEERESGSKKGVTCEFCGSKLFASGEVKELSAKAKKLRESGDELAATESKLSAATSEVTRLTAEVAALNEKIAGLEANPPAPEPETKTEKRTGLLSSLR